MTSDAGDRRRPDPAALAVPPDAGVATRTWLVAVLTLVCLEAVRASGPLLDRWFAVGTLTAALAAVVTFGGAGLVAGLLLVVTSRRDGGPDGRTVFVGALLLAGLRLVLQALTRAPADGTDHVGLAFDVLGLVTVAVAIAVLTLAVAHVAGTTGPLLGRGQAGAGTPAGAPDRRRAGWPGGARQAALGLVLGSSLSVALQLVLGAWDAVWRTGWVGWEVTLVVVATLVVSARALLGRAGTGPVAIGRPRRLWAVGPYVGLAALVGANPAFAASQSGVALGIAGLVLVAALTAGAWLLLRPEQWHGSLRVAAAVLLVGGAAGAMWLDDWGALVALAVFDVVVGMVLTGALSSRRTAPPGVGQAVGAATVVGLGVGAPLLLYYLDYDVPLPFDNAWLVVAGAVVLALTGLRRRTPGLGRDGADAAARPAAHRPAPARVNAVRLLLLPPVVLALIGLVPSGTTTHGADVPARAASDELTLLDWNLHYEVSPLTAVDLEGIARHIEAEHPDVVTLQEVARGWILAGGVDAATWLAHRLGMTVEFAPAADRQFGNAILARSALTDVAVHPLPYGDGPQERSALSATLTTASGTPVRVTSVHLQHRETNTPTRLAQLRTLLAAEPPTGAALMAGDLNATPGSPEVTLVEGAGWVSAVDAVGDAGAVTSPSIDPAERIDWVFGHGVTFTSAQVPTGPRQSDHLPVVVRLKVGG